MEFMGNGRTNSFNGWPTQILPVLHLVTSQTAGVAVTAQIKVSTQHFCLISSLWTNEGGTEIKSTTHQHLNM